jgi:hypothetical protein
MNDKPSISITGVNINLGKAATELASIARELAAGGAKALLPDYAACAQGLYRITTLVRASMWRIDRTINDFQRIDFGDPQTAEAELRRLSDMILGRENRDIAHDMKFSCAQIETIFSAECKNKDFLVRLYNAVFNRADAESAAKIIHEMTESDGNMVRMLSEGIIEPLRKYAEKVKGPGGRIDLARAEELHPDTSAQLRDVSRVVERTLDMLDDAVIAFSKVVRKPVGPVAAAPPT